MKETQKRIAVVGIGGVGGFLAGMLGQACSHLTLVARGSRRDALLENGLFLHSDYKGEIHIVPEQVVPAEELGEQDYIFVCVKNYSLEEACRSIAHAVTEKTVIIPVMNGVDPGDRIRSFLGRGTVIDSLIYIVTFANKDYSVTQQGNFADLYIGIQNADEQQMEIIKNVHQILKEAGLDCEISDDIERDIWKKYILNCAYNVESAYYDNSIGQLREDPVKAKEYEALVNEAYQVARAKGVKVTQEHVDAIIHRFYYELAYDATSSLQRDMRIGKTAELDTFSGYIVREAERQGVDAPVSQKMYQGLLMKQKQFVQADG